MTVERPRGGPVERQAPAFPGAYRGTPGARSLPTTYSRHLSPVAPPPRVPARPGYPRGPVPRALPRPAAQPPKSAPSEGGTRGPAPIPADLGRPFPPGQLNASPRSETLSVSKVVAGGMAASTSAVLGSYLGAFGTVGGAALGAVATAVVSHFYQHSIDTMHNRVRSKARTVRGRPALEQTALVQQSTSARPASRRVRPHRVLAAGTLMIFLFALAVVTGIEWAKGSSLSGGADSTSLQGVLHPSRASQPPRADLTQPQVAPDEEGGQPGTSSCLSDASCASGSSCPSDRDGSSDTGRSGDSGRSSDASCPSGSSCPSDLDGSSDTGQSGDSGRSSDSSRSGDSGRSSDASCPSGSSCPSDLDRSGGTDQSSDSSRQTDSSCPNEPKRPKKSSHSESSPESTEPNSPNGATNPQCRNGSYPLPLCGPLRLSTP